MHVLSSADEAGRLMFHRETGQVAVCCQNLPLGALNSRSAPSVLVDELFKKFGRFLNVGVYQCALHLIHRVIILNYCGNFGLCISTCLPKFH